jgi:hypothetical protein
MRASTWGSVSRGQAIRFWIVSFLHFAKHGYECIVYEVQYSRFARFEVCWGKRTTARARARKRPERAAGNGALARGVVQRRSQQQKEDGEQTRGFPAQENTCASAGVLLCGSRLFFFFAFRTYGCGRLCAVIASFSLWRASVRPIHAHARVGAYGRCRMQSTRRCSLPNDDCTQQSRHIDVQQGVCTYMCAPHKLAWMHKSSAIRDRARCTMRQ